MEMKENPQEWSKWQIWIQASRPKTLWAAVAPVIIGTAMAFADGKGHWPSALLATLGAVLIQIGTNFANDYFDFHKGADEGERLGPLRVTQAGLVSPATIKRATVLVFTLAFLSGLYLIWRGGLPILIIGLLSILFGVLYTGGPYPLGYYGLGDIFVLIFFGLVAVGGTYYVQAREIHWYVLVAGIAPGLFSTALLTVNNLRDIYSDREAGKRTLAVRFGETFARFEYLFCIVVASLMPVVLVALTGRHWLSLLASLVMVAAMGSMRIILKEKPGRIFNQVLADTGKWLLIYSLLFSLGWVL